MMSMKYLKRMLLVLLLDLVTGFIVTVNVINVGPMDVVKCILLIILFVILLYTSISLIMENVEMFVKMGTLEKICIFDTNSLYNLKRIEEAEIIIWYLTGDRGIILIDFKHNIFEPFYVHIDRLIIDSTNPSVLSIDELEGVVIKNGDC